ncbi:unnamed protein product, partial [Lampetra planeri]
SCVTVYAFLCASILMCRWCGYSLFSVCSCRFLCRICLMEQRHSVRLGAKRHQCDR